MVQYQYIMNRVSVMCRYMGHGICVCLSLYGVRYQYIVYVVSIRRTLYGVNCQYTVYGVNVWCVYIYININNVNYASILEVIMKVGQVVQCTTCRLVVQCLLYMSDVHCMCVIWL